MGPTLVRHPSCRRHARLRGVVARAAAGWRRLRCGSGARPPRGPRRRRRRPPARKPPASVLTLPVSRCTRALGPRTTGEKKTKKMRLAQDRAAAQRSVNEAGIMHGSHCVRSIVLKSWPGGASFIITAWPRRGPWVRTVEAEGTGIWVEHGSVRGRPASANNAGLTLWHAVATSPGFG